MYASQPAQKPVADASSARTATSDAERGAERAQPAAYAIAAAEEAAPTMFAKRGGRASSSGPSPKRGWTSSKYARHGRQ